MILTTQVSIPTTNRTIKKLIKSYDIKDLLNDSNEIIISIDKLKKGSHVKIQASCDYCGKILTMPYKSYNLRIKDIKKISCSDTKCSNQKIKDVCLLKYGVENVFQSEKIKDKIKIKFKETYGVDHQMHLSEVKDKIKKTNLERYGVENVFQSNDFKEKSKKTNLERYGVEFTLQVDAFRQKGIATNLIKYGVTHSMQSQEVRNKVIQTNIDNCGFKCNLSSPESKEKIKSTNLIKYGGHPLANEKIRSYTNISNDKNYMRYIGEGISEFYCSDKGHLFYLSSQNYSSRNRSLLPLCTICYPINSSVSIKEEELYNFILENYKGEIIQSYRNGLEIDIFIPDLKIGFEFNGLFWHSEKYKESGYHLNKTSHFRNIGIRIFHIWEDDWDLRKDIIKSMILNLFFMTKNKIYARKCEIKLIESKICCEFLDKNHIQGKDKSSIRIGLFYGQDLMSVMTFNKFEGRDKMKENEWNLSRFSSKLGTNVIGGAGKLINWFIKNNKPSRLISYADMDWSIGDLYFKLGFSELSRSRPDYKYIVNNIRKNKRNFTKSKLKLTDISESQHAKSKGLLRIFDCGKIKFELKIY